MHSLSQNAEKKEVGSAKHSAMMFFLLWSSSSVDLAFKFVHDECVNLAI